MHRLLLFCAFVPAVLFGAAPAAIGGKVYRESLAITSLRGISEKTILFGADGRFVYLKLANVNLVSQAFAQGSVLLAAPPADGIYTYTKTGESTGTAELLHDGGIKITLLMEFLSASAGASFSDPRFPYLTFSLSDLSAVQNAPAMNVSMRGRVAAGQPVVVGFVVPGIRPPVTGLRVTSPDANQRDVLIRVVGPSLSQFGVAGNWVDPSFQLFRGSAPAGDDEFHYADWSIIPTVNGGTAANPSGVAAFKKIFNHVGAFPLLDGSKDAAAVVRLAPGAYTIVANPAKGDAGGEVLVEAYFLP